MTHKITFFLTRMKNVDMANTEWGLQTNLSRQGAPPCVYIYIVHALLVQRGSDLSVAIFVHRPVVSG